MMKLIDKKISLTEIKLMSKRMFGGLVKGVVDINQEIIVLDAAMHADEEQLLLFRGSDQNNLWGFNLYPDLTGDDFIEFDSMINVRPPLNNFSRNIENEEIKTKIIKILNKLIKK